MYYITIDCGTTNSRVYVVDGAGKVYGKATKKVGVRNTAITGSKEMLRDGLRETIVEAVKNAGLGIENISAVFSSGMITSEIGLFEIPHLMAPCGVNDLADSITHVKDIDLINGIPVYFVRGIKNNMSANVEDPFAEVGKLDFMRGEETQVAGMLLRKDLRLPATVVILSSHTKFIPIEADGTICGSLTTMSGQTYEAIKDHTFVGKSVEKRDDMEVPSKDYFDEKVVKNAVNWIKKVGIVRTLMFPRFLDVLLDTKWYERRLFFEALIAVEDMLSIGQLEMFFKQPPKHFVLVGLSERCKLYSYILRETLSDFDITVISDVEEIDRLSIDGILNIAERAGIVNE